MSLPCNFHYETDLDAGVLVGAAESIHNIELILVGELLGSDLLDFLPAVLRKRLVVVLVLRGGPPYGVLAGVIENEELVLGGTSGVNAGHYVDGTELGYLALVIAGQRRISLFHEQLIIRRVVNNFLNAGNTVLFQIILKK